MEAIALTITGVISSAILIEIAASCQYGVAFLMHLGLSQEAAVLGPLPVLMSIGLLIEYCRCKWMMRG